MLYDSTFSPWLATPAVTFTAEKPLIRVSLIERGLDRVEAIGEAVQATTEELTEQLLRRLQRAEVQQIADATWGLSPLYQRQLVGLWRQGMELGSSHGKEEMVAAISPEDRRDALATRFKLDDRTLSLIAALLTDDVGFIIPLNVQRAIQNRVLKIAGDYSAAILQRVKASLLASKIPGTDGTVISQRELQRQIQETLSVSLNRARNIARTETTYSYNTARVTEFNKSELVEGVRFIAIEDTRTTDICRSRNGMVIPKENAAEIAANRPPLHYQCRSLLSPLLPRINPDHKKMIEAPDRQPQNRNLAELLEGWRN